MAQCAGRIAALNFPWLQKKHLKGLLVGEFTDWRAVDGKSHAGSKMLPLKPIAQISLHLQIGQVKIRHMRFYCNLNNTCYCNKHVFLSID